MRSPSPVEAAAPRLVRLGDAVALLREHRAENRPHLDAAALSRLKSAVTTRILALRARIVARGVVDGRARSRPR